MIRLIEKKELLLHAKLCLLKKFLKLGKIKSSKDQNLIPISIIYKSLASRANDSATSPDRPMKLRANLVKLLSSS